MRPLVVWALKFYRKYLSALNIRCCKFYPSCSEYAIGSVEKHGVLFGGIKSAWRLIRCNPFSRGGYDPVQ
ncbi:MAG: membrane protein insertion efficiency factor YidD [Candidatus Omnitrophota bacterium]|nr:membrane protein insertion efficiency factor YidD [Candidatus Omnitrophota bacterium]